MSRRHKFFSKGMALVALFMAAGVVRADSGRERFDEAMKPILASYLEIKGRLAADSVQGVRTAAKSIADAAARLDATDVTGESADRYKDLPTGLERAAEAVRNAEDLDAAREAFKRLSEVMIQWVRVSRPEDVVVMTCSMAKGSWLQKEPKVSNPYYGASMLGCGEPVDLNSAATKPQSR